MMKLWQSFMKLKPSVKMFIIGCLTLLLLAFMYFAYESGYFGVIVNGLFSDGSKK